VLNLFQQFQSYLQDVVLESAQSDYNRRLEVVARRGRLMLCTDNAIYSFDDLYLNFRQSFRTLDIAGRQPRTVLILGFGLGSIPYLLEHTFRCKPRCTGVDIDPEVIRLAQKYTLPRLSLPVELQVADAQAFLENCMDTFDVVCIDLFIDDFVPQPFEQEIFLEKAKKCVAPEGLLLFNRLSRIEPESIATERFMEEHFLPVFPGAVSLDLETNRMLVWENSPEEYDEEEEDFDALP
jgi:predicted membrane-bound spermidine synthase